MYMDKGSSPRTLARGVPHSLEKSVGFHGITSVHVHVSLTLMQTRRSGVLGKDKAQDSEVIIRSRYPLDMYNVPIHDVHCTGVGNGSRE